MATFYIQLENKLLQISGELTNENISKALGYVPVSPNVTNELSQRVDNITFDSLKDNPFLQDGSGELNIVDEAGNIIAKIDADGIHSVDFIAGNHKLTDKIDSSALNGYATESYVNTNLQNYATKDEVSDLVDMSVVTELQGKVETLVGEDVDKSVRDIAVDVLTETLVSETATEAYDTLAEMSAWIKSHPEDAAAMNTAIQKNATDIQSNATAISNLDAAYKAADAKVLTDAQEYTDNINFYTIKDNPIVDGEAGSITFVDESGNVGFQINEDGLRVTDVIAGEHKLSEKANASDIPSLDGYVKTEDIPSLDGLVKSEDLPNFDEFAKTEDIPSLDGYASKEWVNNRNYATEYDLKTIDYSTINNVPVSDDETGELNITDESGNIGMKVASEAVYAKDFIAGEHKLSEKQGIISDIEDIRSGAAKGATAVQPEDIQNSAEPMVCAYRITSYTANHIDLENYTHNGQTMDYREGAIILITNPLGEDVVFEGGTLTLDGNEYETDAFTLKVGATTLFSLGADPGVLFPVSLVVESNSGGSSEGGEYLPLTGGTLTGNLIIKQGALEVFGDIYTYGQISGSWNPTGYNYTFHGSENGLTISDKFEDNVGEIIFNGDGTKVLTDDLSYKTLPTKTSELTNDSGFLQQDDYGNVLINTPDAEIYSPKVGATVFICDDNRLNFDNNGIYLEDSFGDDILNIINTGDGSKFLADDGTYKEVSVGGSSSGNGAYSEINHGTSDSAFELTPNTFHVWDEVATLDLSLGAETSGVANEYLFQFTSGSTPTTLTLPDNIKFSEDLVIEANKIYQISILKGLGSVLSWDSVVSIFPIVLVNGTTTDAGKQVYIELEKLGENGELEAGLLYVEIGGYSVGVTTFAFDSTRNSYRLTFGTTSTFLDSSGYCYVIVTD